MLLLPKDGAESLLTDGQMSKQEHTMKATMKARRVPNEAEARLSKNYEQKARQ
jgi:hypothetical protein